MSQEFSRNHTLQALECSKVRQTFTCYPHFIQIHKIGLWDKFSHRYHWFRNSCDKSLVTSVSASRKLRELEMDPTGFASQSVVHEALVNRSGSPPSCVFFDFEKLLWQRHISFWLFGERRVDFCPQVSSCGHKTIIRIGLEWNGKINALPRDLSVLSKLLWHVTWVSCEQTGNGVSDAAQVLGYRSSITLGCTNRL